VTIHDPVLEIRDLSFRYPKTHSGRSVTALHHVSMSIHPGEFTVITGSSGSGKSTLARCLNGLIPHATNGTMDGEVIVMGMNTRDYDVPDFAPHLGMVFQDPGYQMVTGDVESEIAFGLEIQNFPESFIRGKLDRIADLLRIRHLLGRTINDLSWGERQRVAIVSVLAVEPSILVMDEPFSGIDSSAMLNLTGVLGDLKKKHGTTIIIFEHRTGCISSSADRWVVMDRGTIIADGKPGTDSFNRNRQTSRSDELPYSCSAHTPAQNDHPDYHQNPSPGPALPAPVLSLRDVVYRYPGVQSTVLDGISLDFYPGEITLINGANGSGKTTLLKHCNGLLIPDQGSVLLGQDPVSQKTVAAIAQTVGLLNQHADYQLFESTIAEELAFGPRNLGKNEELIAGILKKTLLECSLDHIDPLTPPLGLSGGEKQRVALAGILAMGTPVVVLDEPTFGLDPGLKHSLTELLHRLCRSGKTVIVATHDEEFGQACGNRFIRIAAGRIESDYRKFPISAIRPIQTGESGELRGGAGPGEY